MEDEYIQGVGGVCTCPDGQKYEVGGQASEACYGGTLDTSIAISNNSQKLKVTCDYFNHNFLSKSESTCSIVDHYNNPLGLQNTWARYIFTGILMYDYVKWIDVLMSTISV